MAPTSLPFRNLRRWIAALACAAPALAEGPVRQPHAEAELVCAQQSVQPGRELRVGLRLRLDPGWHAYWRNAGDAGLAPHLEWRLPAGFVAHPCEWPAPRRIPMGPLMTFGYEGDLLLPVRVTVPATIEAAEVTLVARAEWLVCREVCVPGEATLALTLQVRDRPPQAAPRWRALFAEAERRLPRPLPPEALAATRRGGRIELRVAGIAADTLAFFPLADGVVENAAPQPLTRAGEAIMLGLTPAKGADGPPERLRGVLVASVDGDRRASYAVDVAVHAPAPPPGGVAAGTLVLVGLILAGLGTWIYRRRDRTFRERSSQTRTREEKP
ncbi:MAG: protein-disulfide reductase DsbD domain-containing protein [Planctomycetota bacterium]|jgi:thiol:disulfide interchange protein DsbD